MTLIEMFQATARRVPDRPALTFRNTSLTYGALEAGAAATASRLWQLGVSPRDRVLLMLPNLPEFGVAYLGISGAGATVLPVNPMLKADEIRYILEDSGATAMVCLEASLPLLRAARAGLSRRPPILVLGGAAGELEAPDTSLPLPAASGLTLPEPGRDDGSGVAVCLYTSGTTGRPKGALLTHRNLLANLDSCRRVMELREEDVFLAVLPFFHAYGGTILFLLPLCLGATCVVEPRFVPEAILKAVGQHRVTLFAAVPSMLAVLANLPDGGADLRSLRYCLSGGAPLPPAVLEAFERRYGVLIFEGYGPTECAPVLTVNPPGGLRKIGSVGPAIPDVAIRVVGPDGTELPRGEVGEVIAFGPNVMLGYLHKPVETAAVLRDGWYATGDLGRMDEDGYLYIVDRKTDLIIVGGLNVYPSEVERVLQSHAAVAEATVIGVPDSVRGEAPKALVIPRDGARVTSPELLQWCRQRLANYKVPRTIEIVAELPRTVTGKVLKTELRRMAE
jgi:long-chain acyl-CoA synthetase